MTERGIARDGHAVYLEGKAAGEVTSGSYAPYLKKNIGMAYLPTLRANVEQEIEIEIRGKLAGARIVPLPFYKRQR